MTQTVVVAAGRPAVVLDGGPARRVRLHVVDLAVLGATVAERMEALPVAHLDGAGDGAGEEAPAHPDCTRSGPSSTTRSTHARSSRRTRLSEGDRLHPRARQGEHPVECSVDAHVRCLLVRLSWQIPNLKGGHATCASFIRAGPAPSDRSQQPRRVKRRPARPTSSRGEGQTFDVKARDEGLDRWSCCWPRRTRAYASELARHYR